MPKIYTRTGDQGQTHLGNGNAVAKDHPQVEACGSVDELNAHLGLLLSQLPDRHPLRQQLELIQHQLFDLGAELSAAGKTGVDQETVNQLEVWIDTLDADLPTLKKFILPGGTLLAAQAHVVRTVCRRAERRVSAFARNGGLGESTVKYLNRLSDYLFVVARTLNHGSVEETLWQAGVKR